MSAEAALRSISRPRVTLRVGFAGTQHLPPNATYLHLDTTLKEVFEVIGIRLMQIAPSVLHMKDKMPSRVAQFFSHKKAPLLRVVTGLCQGADLLAGRMLRKLASEQPFQERLKTELAAVLPFDIASYRASRDASCLDEFDRQAQECSYILALDARHEKFASEPPFIAERRARAYRAQSTVLLRHADIVVAVGWIKDATGKPGGTTETIRASMEFGLPIVFIDAAWGCVTVIRPGDDPAETFTRLGAKSEKAAREVDAQKREWRREKEKKIWKSHLRAWVSHIIADPEPVAPERKEGPENETPGDERKKEKPDYAVQFLTEFFSGAEDLPDPVPGAPAPAPLAPEEPSLPQQLWNLIINHRFVPEMLRIWMLDTKNGLPRVPKSRFLRRRKSLGEYGWDRLTSLCQPRGPEPARDMPLAPYDTWRERTKNLSYYYQGCYRGAFLLNYLLAALAIALAALSLLLLTVRGWEHVIIIPLIGIAMFKLICVSWIYGNTALANGRDWNDRAVDYRYLAERLRSMYYLPLVGSFQPPFAGGRRNANMTLGQSAVEWLFGAIIRSVSPAELETLEIKPVELGKVTMNLRMLSLNVHEALDTVRNNWVSEQIAYHYRVAHTMGKVSDILVSWGKQLNLAVIVVVIVDILIEILIFAQVLPEDSRTATPFLVFIAAILPAAVAGLNGILSQSDSERLSDRSEKMYIILGGEAHAREHQLVRPRPPKLHKKEHVKTLATPRLAKDRWRRGGKLYRKMEYAQKDPATNPDSWTPQVLRYTESVAEVFVQEVAEWQVLYAKEVPET